MQADIPLRGMKQWVRANQFLPRVLYPSDRLDGCDRR